MNANIQINRACLLVALSVIACVQSAASLPGDTEPGHCIKEPGYVERVAMFKEGKLPLNDTTLAEEKHVVIVGAGVSGLMAAKMLQDTGFKVTILEASDRVGGRIQTYRDFEDGWHRELGAMRIPYSHQHVANVVEKYNIKMKDFEWDAPLGGPWMTSWGEDDPEYAALFDKAITSGMEYYKNNNLSKIIKAFDHENLLSYLNKQPEIIAHPVPIDEWKDKVSRLRIMGYHGLLDTFSMFCLNEHTAHNLTCPEDGMDSLPRALYHDGLEEHVLFNAKVVSVKEDDSGVEVKFDCKGLNCPEVPNYQSTIQGDYVIMTTSPRATPFINFEPEMEYELKAALLNINFWNALKVVLVFEDYWWLNSTSAGTEEQWGNFYMPKESETDGPGVILAEYSWDSEADSYMGLSDEEITRDILQKFAVKYEKSYQFVKNKLVDSIIKKWTDDKYSLGAFTWYKQGQYKIAYDNIQARHGRMSFAGEHTAMVHGWIDPAFDSGIRAAVQAAEFLVPN